MININKRRSIIQVVCFVVIFVGTVIFLYKQTYPVKLILGGKVFSVEVSDTKELLEKGLSGHKPLENDGGMLFIFSKSDKHGFWMKDMLFPIDIIWMDSSWRIIHIEKSLTPDTYPKIFTPQSDSMYVLEISSGESENLGLNVGDDVQFIGK